MSEPILLIVAAIVTAILGALITQLRNQRIITALREHNRELTTTLDLERRNTHEKIQTLEQARVQLTDTFNALSSQALKHNNEAFLKLAEENLKQFHAKAQGELTQKEKSIEHLLRPMRETLEKTDVQIREMEKERKQAYGSLHKHLEQMALAQETLQGETRNLVQALRRPEIRGQWGELTLKRLAELAGMVKHCDFYEQTHIATESGSVRPDMIVRMPDGREVVVDAKAPLDAYLNAIKADDDETRQRELSRHARQVRERVRELANKAYWSQFTHAPEFVVLFIPGDQFLSSALEQDHNLLEYALQQKVILATPTSLVALLRAVAYGWRQEQLAHNAELIKQIGNDLYHRLTTFTEHLNKLGRSLDGSVKSYNSAVGAFDSRVLPGARKFSELGIGNDKAVEQPQQIETGPRTIEAPASVTLTEDD